MKTARYALMQPAFIRQAGESEPKLIQASHAAPVVVVLDARTKENPHMKRLADDEQPKPVALKPAHADIKAGGGSVPAREKFSVPLDAPKAAEPAPAATPALPVEGGKKGGRAADKD